MIPDRGGLELQIARTILDQFQRRGIIAKYKRWETIESHQREMFLRYAAEILDDVERWIA